MFAAYILTLALAVVQTTALIPTDNSPMGLLRRQLPGIDPSTAQVPDQCQSQCSALMVSASKCITTDPTCLCTESVNQGFATCLNCFISIAGTPEPYVAQGVQQSLGGFEDACKMEGHALSSLTLAGATVAPGGATGAATSTASATGAKGVASATIGNVPAQTGSTGTGTGITGGNANTASIVVITPLGMLAATGAFLSMFFL